MGAAAPMLLCATAPAAAVEPSSVHSQAYAFLDVPASSRIYGLGGVNVSSVDAGVMAIGQNPALLGPEFDRELGVSYMRYMAGSNFAAAAFANRAGERSAWGAEVRYFGYGSIDRTDPTGAVTGSFSPKDIAVSATYSADITERLRGGATLRCAYSAYDSYSAVAIGADLGVNYYDPDRDLSLSLVAVHLGGQVKRFDERYERLPVDVRMGWTQSFPGLPVRFSVTAWQLTKWHLPYYDNGDGTDGAEPRIRDSFGSNLMRHLVLAADVIPSERFNICLAYNYKTRTDMAAYSRTFLSGFSLGAGINVSGWSVGVALAQPHRGATTLMVNLSAALGNLIN